MGCRSASERITLRRTLSDRLSPPTSSSSVTSWNAHPPATRLRSNKVTGESIGRPGRDAPDHSADTAVVIQLRCVVTSRQNYQALSIVGRYPTHYHVDNMVIPCPECRVLSQTCQPEEGSDSREGGRKRRRKGAAAVPNVRSVVPCGALLEEQAC